MIFKTLRKKGGEAGCQKGNCKESLKQKLKVKARTGEKALGLRAPTTLVQD